MLLTPPHDDAITFSYEDVAFSDMDFHRADTAPSWARDEAATWQKPDLQFDSLRSYLPIEFAV